MPGDDSMIGPGAHEQAAHNQAMEGDNDGRLIAAVRVRIDGRA